ncbi:TPA: hypothetical protein DCQ44_01415 [Candidatus Taylorbacteria bacterium]|nr:hypothetical protein [Candidatus Taylorbacteria bacterium]
MIKKNILLIIFAFGFIFTPSFTFAARIFFDPSVSEVDIHEMFKVSVLVDTEGETINSVESTLNFPKDILRLDRIEDGGSFITLWLEKPTENDGSVHSSGIVPRGFSGLIQALDYPKLYAGTLMTLVFDPIKSGTGTIGVTGARVLLNDGAGSEAKLATDSFQFNVTKNVASKSLSSDDNVPPDFTVAEVQDEPALGGLVVIFAANDKESGIDHYELQKNGSWITISSPYPVSSGTSELVLKAVDRAGNERIQVLEVPKNLQTSHWYTSPVATTFELLFILVLISIFVVVYGKRRQK